MRFLAETETWLCQENALWATSHVMTVFIPALVDKMLFNFLKWWRHQWRHECMTYNMHNYTSPPIYLQTIVCAVSVYFIQIVGTNIMPNKHTNTIGEDITSLSRMIDKMNTDKHDQIWTRTPKYLKKRLQ